jgi:hypothetical protein
MTHYRHLSQIGQLYTDTPEEGTVGHRVDLGNGVEAGLQSYMQARDARLALSNAGGDLKTQLRYRREYLDQCNKIREFKERYSRQGFFFNPDGTIDWALSGRVVVYDHDPALREMSRLRIAGGRIYTDDAHTVPLDTSQMTTAKSGNGWAIYVMGATGNIHVSSHVVGNRHHSSLLCGNDVAAAGELKVRTGFLEAISNKTGHYQAKLAHFVQILHQLQKDNVGLQAVTIRHLFYRWVGDNEQMAEYNGIQAFNNYLAANEFDTEVGAKASDYEYAKLLAYLGALPMAQFNMMAGEIGWRWVTNAEYMAGGRVVVRVNNATPIPHKWVRKWLKGRGYLATNLIQSGVGRSIPRVIGQDRGVVEPDTPAC